MKFLGTLEQEYINPALEKGPQTLKDVAVLSIDYEGFTRFARNLTETVDQPKYASREMAKHMSLGLNEARETIRAYGGMMNGVFGDGTSAVFTGERAVAKAILAARAIENKIQTLQAIKVRGIEAPWRVRFGISFGDAMVVSYGDGERRADLTGGVVKEAEELQKQAKPGAYSIVLAPSAEKRLSRESEVFYKEEIGAYTLSELAAEDKTLDLAESALILPEEPAEIEKWVAFREKHLSQTRREEVKNQFFRKEEPEPDMLPISTLFVRLKGLDLEKTTYERANSFMSAVFEIANDFRGKVDKVHHDSVMINFIAGDHELNSAMAAVRIKEEIENLKQKFGEDEIELAMACTKGYAFLLVVGGNRTVYGESVNKASRLLYTNNPGGGLVVDEITFQKINRARVESEPLRPIQLKGYEKPIPVHLIKNIETMTFRHIEAEKVVGLEEEMARLNQYYEEAKEEGRIVSVKGPSGIGKTLLVASFIRDKEEHGVKVIEGRAERATQNISFALWKGILESAFTLQNISQAERKQAIIEEYLKVNNLWKNQGEKLALLNAVLGLNFSESDTTRYLAPEEREEMRAELTAEILKSFASLNQPAIVFMEDIHFFDRDSANLTARVLPRLGARSALQVLTTWIEGEEDERVMPLLNSMKTLAHYREIPVEPLPIYEGDYYRDIPAALQWWEEEKENYLALASNIGIEFDPEDLERNEKAYARFFINISQTSKGIPRHVLEILEYFTRYQGRQKDYFREKEVMRDGEKKVYYALGEARIGDEEVFGQEEITDIYKIEQGKLENLSGDVKAILRDASVVGMIFDEKILRHISGLSLERIRKALRNARVALMVRDLGDGRWEFSHSTTQHAIYESIGKVRERQANHRLIAEYLAKNNPDDLRSLVHHYRHSDDYLKALYYLDLYAEQLKKAWLYGTALDQIRYATRLGFEEEPGAKGGIFEKIRELGWRVFDESKDFRTLRELSDGEKDSLLDAEIKRVLRAVDLWRSIGERKKALEIVESAKTLFAETHPPFEKMELHDQLIWVRLHKELGRDKTYAELYDEARTDLMTSLDLLRMIEAKSSAGDGAADLDALKAEIYGALGWWHKETQHLQEALNWYEKALPLATSYDDRVALGNGQAVVYKALGQTERAGGILEELILLARERGEKGDEVVLLNNLAGLAAVTGDLSRAEALYREAERLAKSISKTTSAYYAQAGLGFIKRNQGDYNLAAELFEGAAQYFEKSGFRRAAAIARAEQTFSLIKSGQFNKARELLPTLVKSPKKSIRGRALTLGAMLDVESTGLIQNDTLQKFESGIGLLRESGQENDLAFDLLYFGELEIQHGRVEEGLAKAREAKEIYERIGELAQMSRIESILKRQTAEVS